MEKITGRILMFQSESGDEKQLKIMHDASTAYFALSGIEKKIASNLIIYSSALIRGITARYKSTSGEADSDFENSLKNTMEDMGYNKCKSFNLYF